MSAIPIASHKPRSAGHDWFERHLPELISRCRAFTRRVPDHVREEAQAEILASIFQYVLRAERRGKLSALTPFTLVSFFGRAFCDGRRMTGSSRTDVMSVATQRRRGFRVISLETLEPDSSGDGFVRLAEVLADPKADRPLENTRRNVDYPEILDQAGASRKVKRMFTFFCETAGAGKQKDLARELGVSAPRVCQLKDELADILAANGYEPPTARKSEQRPNKRGRPAGTASRYLEQTPLNPGTSPARRRRHRRGRRGTSRVPVARRLPAVRRDGSKDPQRKEHTTR